MISADLYIRVSTDEQADKGFSQRYQEEILKKYCELNNIKIQATVFEDFSAKTFDRPAWAGLTDAYKKKPSCRPQYLLFSKWDRFSRNTGDAYYMIRLLAKWNIEARAIEQPLDLSIPENKIMMAFFLAAPEVENERRALNIKQGMDRARREGRWMGGAPIGYINKVSENGEKFIQPKEPEATILRNAFQNIANGNIVVTKVYEIAVESGLQVSLNCFRKAIRNPVYCGRILLNRVDNNKPQYSIGNHKAIISEDLFFTVQELLNRPKKISPRSVINENFPLRGFLMCTKCNKILTGSGSTGRRLKKYYYYHCLPKCGVRIRTNYLHEHLLLYLKRLVPTEYYISIFKSVFKQLLNKTTRQARLSQGSIFNKIEKLISRIERAKQLLLDGSIDGKDFKSIKESAETQINILGELLSKAMMDLARLNQTSHKSVQQFSKLDLFYESLDIHGKRELLNGLFPYGIKDYEFENQEISNALKFIFDNTLERSSNIALAEFKSNTIEDIDEILQTASKIYADHNDKITMAQAKEISSFLKKATRLSIDLLLEKHFSLKG